MDSTIRATIDPVLSSKESVSLVLATQGRDEHRLTTYRLLPWVMGPETLRVGH